MLKPSHMQAPTKLTGVDAAKILSRAVGGLLALLSIAMLLPFAVAVANSEKEQWTYLTLAVIGVVVGTALFLQKSGDAKLRARQVFLLTSLCWLSASLFSALPFIFAQPYLSFADAWFESMSAITTTGATVIVGLDNLPRAVLLWRGMLQWLGGIGIIVMAMAILPFLQVGGMRLFQAESSDISGKFMPRSSNMVFAIGRVYILLTLLVMLLYWFGGMHTFDAIVHGMTTIATARWPSPTTMATTTRLARTATTTILQPIRERTRPAGTSSTSIATGSSTTSHGPRLVRSTLSSRAGSPARV